MKKKNCAGVSEGFFAGGGGGWGRGVRKLTLSH